MHQSQIQISILIISLSSITPNRWKVQEKVEYLLQIQELNDQYKDELFMTIRKNPELRKILKKITILLQYLTLFSWFFLILAVISLFFYTKKTALILFGLTSIIHIIFAPLALVALKKQNRYLLFSFCLVNLVWLTSITFAFFYFLFIGKLYPIGCYHLHFIFISSLFHLHFILISSNFILISSNFIKFHLHFIFISSLFHQILSLFHLHFTKFHQILSYFILFHPHLADSHDESKIQFNKEIVVHVGFAFYYPIAFFTTFYCMKMFKMLIESVKELNMLITAKVQPTKTETVPKGDTKL